MGRRRQDRRLTDLEAAFVAEYLVDRNATQAAKRAGYADPGQAHKVRYRPGVKAAIEKAEALRHEETLKDVVAYDRRLEKLALGMPIDSPAWARVSIEATRLYFHRHGHLKDNVHLSGLTLPQIIARARRAKQP